MTALADATDPRFTDAQRDVLERFERAETTREAYACTCGHEGLAAEWHADTCGDTGPAADADGDQHLVTWRECTCDWVTKTCDELHVSHAVIPGRLLRDPAAALADAERRGEQRVARAMEALAAEWDTDDDARYAHNRIAKSTAARAVRAALADAATEAES